MRIGVIGPTGPDDFADNIADSLTRMGHFVTQLGPARRKLPGRFVDRAAILTRQAFPQVDERIQRRIVHAAREAACEIIINIDARLMPDTVVRLRHYGARVAFWFPDHVANMGRQLMFLAPYDALFFKEPHIVDRLRANLDLPIYYMPEACNPSWHKPIGQGGIEPYLIIAGNIYPTRVRLLDRLVSKGIPLRIYGPGFPRWMGHSVSRSLHTGRYLAREEKAKAFRSAAGVLNTMYPAEFFGVNARLFEAAGSGAAVITEFRPTLPDFFEIGAEVLAFNDFDELLSHATRLLRDNTSMNIGDAAASRAHRDHTYDLRLAKILETIS
jgi:spore maturation protein CgeB